VDRGSSLKRDAWREALAEFDRRVQFAPLDQQLSGYRAWLVAKIDDPPLAQDLPAA
jgi:hypothetical protein